MPNSMQEKMQMVAKRPKQPSNEWSSLASNRKVTSQTKLQMPGKQDYMEAMPFTIDSSPLTPDGSVTAKELSQGYGNGKMMPTDDNFTNEHYDEFYADAGGFAERSNYLDRI